MPLEKRPAPTHRGSPAAAARRPFHLRLPDVLADQKPRSTPAPERRPPPLTVANDPTARARAELTRAELTKAQLTKGESTKAQLAPAQSTSPQPTTARLSEKRYHEGQQQVTGIIERVRERRRKLFS